MKFIFITYFSKFGSNVFLALKIMRYEDVVLTKVIDFYVVKNMNV